VARTISTFTYSKITTMELLFTKTLLVFGIALSAQYNYGLDICDQDAKIEGKLNLDSGNFNTITGRNSGIITTESFNCFYGDSSGQLNTSGGSNSILEHLQVEEIQLVVLIVFFGHLLGKGTIQVTQIHLWELFLLVQILLVA